MEPYLERGFFVEKKLDASIAGATKAIAAALLLLTAPGLVGLLSGGAAAGGTAFTGGRQAPPADRRRGVSQAIGAMSGTNVSARHRLPAYPSRSTATISNEFIYPTNRQLLSLRLEWKGALPGGWSFGDVRGDGSPLLSNNTEIVFSGSLSNNPIEFAYTLTATGTPPETNAIQADLEYHLSGMTNPATTAASPVALQVRWRAAHGTPVWWLADYGLTGPVEIDLGDQDGDGALTWEEYAAGTVPTNARSVFRIMRSATGGSSNLLQWYATTNSGITTPCSVFRSTNLVEGWELVVSNLLERAGDGTNVWWDQAPPATAPVFYRPAILWQPE